MRNHGPMVVGRDIGRAFYALYYLEQACRLQLLAMQSGKPLALVTDNLARPVMEAVHSAHGYRETLHRHQTGPRQGRAGVSKIALGFLRSDSILHTLGD